MILDKATRRKIRLQSTLFLVLFLLVMAIIAWLTQLHSVSFDLTKNERNSLSAESIRLAQSLQQHRSRCDRCCHVEDWADAALHGEGVTVQDSRAWVAPDQVWAGSC